MSQNERGKIDEESGDRARTKSKKMRKTTTEKGRVSKERCKNSKAGQID